MLGHVNSHFRNVAELFARRKSRLPEYVSEVIEAAHIMVRHGGDEGPRVFVMLGGQLRGSFEYSRKEASERISKRWPELNGNQVERAVSFLGSRVRLAATPVSREHRKNWIFDY